MRPKNNFTVISTFSGCGGSSLGYTAAGGKVLLAVEWDDNAVETYRLNFPKTPIWHGDIAKLSIKEILKWTGLKKGELHILDGSPPCQGFSTAGKREFKDERNQLFREYVRLLKGLAPKVFVMENVSGMVKGKMKIIFSEILQELKAAGYLVRARVLNSMYFGVPQSRQRMIFIGVRKGLAVEPSHPKGWGRPISAAKALEGVTIEEAEREMLLAAGRKYPAYQDWPKMKPGQCRTDIGRRTGFNCRKLDPRKPAPTVTKTDGNLTMHGSMHWGEQRRFTVSEYKRFASYPEHFRFAGTWSNAVQRIGNSVPPRFMQAIAEHLRDKVLSVNTER